MRVSNALRSGALFALTTLVATSELSAQARWRLHEVARVGGGDEGLASFNDIRDLQLDSKGQLWVLDFQAKSLRLFAAAGTPIREVARAGRGPGEIENSNGIRLAPDGRMILRDHANSWLAIYSSDGKFVDQKPFPSLGYGYRIDAGFDRQGRFHELVTQWVDTVGRRIIVRTTPDFAKNDTVVAPLLTACSPLPVPPNGIRGRNGFASVPFAPRHIQTFGANGSFWCASTDEYRLRRFKFGAAAHDLEVRLNVPRIATAAVKRDSAIAGTEAFLLRIGGAVDPWDKRKVARDRGALLGFETDDRDRLWVMRETREGRAELDVWDVDGRRIATLAPGFRALNFPLMRIHGDRFAIVQLDADDLPTIVIYRIVTQ